MPRSLQPRRFAALASDVSCLYRRDGLRPALGTVARGVGFARHELHVLVKALEAADAVSPAPRLRLDEAGPESLAALAEFNRERCDTRATRRFADNLARRYHGLIAHEDSDLAGYYWWLDATAEPHPHLARLGIELTPRDVYGFDFFLDERHRGGGRAVDFLAQVESRLRTRGYERLWGYVDGENTAARWLYSMRGYEVARTLHRRPGAMRG